MNVFLSMLGLLAIAGPVALGAEQRPPVKGTILELNPPGTITIKISVGSRQTVRIGDVFDIYRDKKQIGSLKVTKAGPRRSTATITDLRREFRLRKGDAVLRDVTMQFARRLMPGVVVKAPAELGRKYAGADVKAGVKRVLYYGKPWSAGKPLIDETTGFPVTIAAGCTVTKNFVQFVDAYNAAMKEQRRREKPRK